ncbi:cardiolipin synthase ClsB [Sideroxydans lithotrophicus]|uniref:Cardiolipin synthase B n=1 Tax=Sideroxydans lithotrophicus (strain ES-1) TaxID=580332 RepID=D5CQ53_SIDLE|nr:cardiolipin synthase ClsB [Sideroxydans lithotrophicus]ADE11217.1 phospholipase D/Transphosphatidylase [Sideroxydans lithotrophicus ES-1]
MNRTHLISGAELMLLQNGAEFFPQLCTEIDAARHSIYLESYIFASDETGNMVAEALQRAAERGVVVRVLLDGFGSAELSGEFVDALRMVGVEVQLFRPEVSPFTLRRSRMRRLRRMHRKLAVMDGAVAFVGGINIICDIPARLGFDAPRLDYAVRVKGELAGEIQAVMQRLWEMVSWAAFRKRVREEGWRRYRVRSHPAAKVRLVLRDNVRHRRDIERAYLNAIAGAQHEVIIANAYFLPGRLFLRALVHAAERGVRVVLMLQGKVEYRLQHYATLALYGRLLAAGVEIYEYHASYLHAKVAVIDGEWATVGSFNIDPFSLLLAREANLAVQDKGFSGDLRGSLWRAIERDGRRVELARANLGTRVLARMSYGLVRLIIGVLGISKSH